MRSSRWFERLTANAKVATDLGSISASSDTTESEGRQMKQCLIKYIKNPKIPLLSFYFYIVGILPGIFSSNRDDF
jgi:hypothetical protein